MVTPGRRIEEEGSWYHRFLQRIPEEAFVAALTAAVGLLLLGLIGEVLLTFLAYLPLIIAITLIATAALVFVKVSREPVSINTQKARQERVRTYARQWIEGKDRFVQFVGGTFFRGESPPALQMAGGADHLLGPEATVPTTEYMYTVGPVTLSLIDDPDNEEVVTITLALTDPGTRPVTVRLFRNVIEQIDESQGAPTLEQTVALSAVQPQVTHTLPRAGGNKSARWEIEVDVPSDATTA